MTIKEELIGGVLLMENAGLEDQRGVFHKLFKADHPAFAQYHINQINYVTTHHQNTLRGLHYQSGPYAESKYFRVVKGSIQLAFVDVRPDSPHYLKGDTVILNSPDLSVLIPRGFATGYAVLVDDTTVLYTSDNEYAAAYERGILWNDPVIQLPWVVKDPLVSDKDRRWKLIEVDQSQELDVK